VPLQSQVPLLRREKEVKCAVTVTGTTEREKGVKCAGKVTGTTLREKRAKCAVAVTGTIDLSDPMKRFKNNCVHALYVHNLAL